MQTHYSKLSAKKPYAAIIIRNEDTYYEYRDGFYNFFHGTVDIYSEKKITSFRFVYKGVLYMKTISDNKDRFTDRQLVLQARKFGLEVINNKTRKKIFK